LAGYILCHFFYIGFWYCKRKLCRPGVQAASDCIWNLKNSLPTRQSVHTDRHHAYDVLSHCSCNTHFHTSSQDNVSRQTHSHFRDITWLTQLPDRIVPRLLPLGPCQKQGTQNSCQKCWLTTVNLGVYSRDPLYPQDCWSVLNEVAVICNVSYSNRTDYYEFFGGLNIFISVNKIIPVCLKNVIPFHKPLGSSGLPWILFKILRPCEIYILWCRVWTFHNQ
jgi:hypothetical protein